MELEIHFFSPLIFRKQKLSLSAFIDSLKDLIINIKYNTKIMMNE